MKLKYYSPEALSVLDRTSPSRAMLLVYVQTCAFGGEMVAETLTMIIETFVIRVDRGIVDRFLTRGVLAEPWDVSHQSWKITTGRADKRSSRSPLQSHYSRFGVHLFQ